jgi:hypothetical protein
MHLAQSGSIKFQHNTSNNVYNMFDRSIIPVIDNSYQISQSPTSLILTKNDLLSTNSCYVKWESDSDAQLFYSNGTDDFTPPNSA